MPTPNVETSATVAANDSNVVFTRAYSRTQICTPTASRTYYMPSTSILAGDIWSFFNTSSTYGVRLQTPGGTNIDFLLPTGYIQLVALVNTPTSNTHWQTISASSQWISAGVSASSFTAGFGTVTNVEVTYKRAGDTLIIRGRAKAGTVAASQGCFILPSVGGTGLTIDSTKITSDRTYALGGSQSLITGGPTAMNTLTFSLVWVYNSAQGNDRIQLAGLVGSGLYTDSNVNSVISNTEGFDFWNVHVPISKWG